MKIDPRIQKFVDEMAEAERDMKMLAAQIADHRLTLSVAEPYHAMTVYDKILPEVSWALRVSRPDIAIRLVGLCETYLEAGASLAMTKYRVPAESHYEAVRAREDGDLPDYLGSGEETPVVRMKVVGADLCPADEPEKL